MLSVPASLSNWISLEVFRWWTWNPDCTLSFSTFLGRACNFVQPGMSSGSDEMVELEFCVCWSVILGCLGGACQRN